MRNPLRSELPHSVPSRPARARLARSRLVATPLTIVVALALAASACGGTEEVDAGAESDQDLPAETADPTTTTDADPADDGSSGDYQPTDAQSDLISGQPAPIDEVRVIDDQTIGVRYQNGSEPCSLADVSVTESDTEITVALQTGLHPNAAAMSCIAQVLGYEIQVNLDAPIGDRTIVPVEV